MKFLDALYIRLPHELHHIITFGRAPEQRARDTACGVARVGGPLREPNYAQAYIHAASLLIANGEADETLDEVALPSFYLQRHAAELLLKQLLSLLLEISVYQARYTEQPAVHTRSEKERFGSTHNLPKLLEDIRNLASKLNLQSPPTELSALVAAIAAVEKTETWPRYSTSTDKRAQTTVNHMAQEVEVPLKAIQAHLTAASLVTAYKMTDGDSYEGTLYEEWYSYARHFGDVG